MSGSGTLETATNVIAQHPDYDVLLQKYGDLIGNMDLASDPAMLEKLMNSGLMQAIQQGLLTNYEDPETVKALMDMIKQLVEADPKLAQALAQGNARGLIQAIRAHQDSPEVLSKILGAVHAIGVADPEALNYLKKVGLDDELVKILKQVLVWECQCEVF